MAKLNVNVDNGLDEVKLDSLDKMEKKNKKKDTKKSNDRSKKDSSKKVGFFKQVAKEMRLVTWPSRKNVVKYSIATILMIVLLALFFVGISALFDLLYGLVQGWIG